MKSLVSGWDPQRFVSDLAILPEETKVPVAIFDPNDRISFNEWALRLYLLDTETSSVCPVSFDTAIYLRPTIAGARSNDPNWLMQWNQGGLLVLCEPGASAYWTLKLTQR